MYFLHIVFVVVYILFPQIQHVKAQAGVDEPPNVQDAAPGYPEKENLQQDSAEYYEDRLAQVDSHTFVTLIDIVFTDGSKKTCTGAIIADHAVITAAHCFITRNEEVQPELTLSFVVLGTKKMYESGFENYIPIERIEIHPDFKGWTADLAIVFTFAGMVTEKSGTIVPLAGEKSLTPVDSNVTVFSWGHCNEGKSRPPKQIQGTAFPDNDEGNKEDTVIQRPQPTQIRADIKSKFPIKTHLRSGSGYTSNYRAGFREANLYTVTRAQKKHHLKSKRTIRNSGSRYLSDVNDSHYINREKNRRNRRLYTRSQEIYENSSNNKNVRTPSEPRENEENSTYRNGRRISESQANNLTVEVFGFVNAQTCKKFIDRNVPALYSIQNKNEVLCYASDMHYITVEDSGAPALQHGKLVAVTVGGVESEGDHLAVGMKMSCFCSWIVETLPMYDEIIKIKCCKNCCDNKHNQAQETNDNQENTDKIPYRPGKRGSKQRYRVADDVEHQHEDRTRKKRYYP